VIAGGIVMASSPLHAADYWWDANGAGGGAGGSGIWDTTSPLWREGSASGAFTTWPAGHPNGSGAQFGGAPGTVTLASGSTISAQSLTFSSTSTIAAGDAASSLALSGEAPTISLGSSTVHFNAPVTLDPGADLTVTGTAISIFGIGSNGMTVAEQNASLGLASGQSLTLFSSAPAGELRVGRDDVAGSKVGSTGSLLAGEGQVNAWLSRITLGIRVASGASTGDADGRIHFGSNEASSLNISATNSSMIGGLFIGSGTFSGNVSAELTLAAGENRIQGNYGSNPLVRLGRIDGINNGTNTAHVSALLQIEGGTTEIVQENAGNRNVLFLAERSSALHANTTVTAEVRVTGGALSIEGGDIYGGGGESIVTLDGGTLDMNGGEIGRSGGLIQTLAFRSGTLRNVGGINNGAGWSKTGSGTLILDGTSSYAGTTTVEEGELILNGTKSGTGTLTIEAGARLGGGGTVAGTTTISGTHAPGNSPGEQHFATLEYESGAVLEWELAANTDTGRGVNFDAINVSGNLTLATGVTANLLFDGDGSLVDWSDPFWSEDRSWLVYSVDGVLDAPVLFESVNWTADSLGMALPSGSFGFYSQGNQVYLRYDAAAAVPEPSTFLTLAGGLALMALLRRRGEA